jgi:hypothetical protein
MPARVVVGAGRARDRVVVRRDDHHRVGDGAWALCDDVGAGASLVLDALSLGAKPALSERSLDGRRRVREDEGIGVGVAYALEAGDVHRDRASGDGGERGGDGIAARRASARAAVSAASERATRERAFTGGRVLFSSRHDCIGAALNVRPEGPLRSSRPAVAAVDTT